MHIRGGDGYTGSLLTVNTSGQGLLLLYRVFLDGEDLLKFSVLLLARLMWPGNS